MGVLTACKPRQDVLVGNRPWFYKTLETPFFTK
jgi:hypothetical protein